jgi:hypothetical protein
MIGAYGYREQSAINVMENQAIDILSKSDAIRSSACKSEDGQIDAQCRIRLLTTAQRDFRDALGVTAQLSSALWTRVMGMTAVFAVFLSAFGIYLIWRTFGETKTAAKAATDTHRAYLATERAYITLHGIKPRFTSSDGDYDDYYARYSENTSTFCIELEVSLKNMGRAPGEVTNAEHSAIFGNDILEKESALIGKILGTGGECTYPIKLVLSREQLLSDHIMISCSFEYTTLQVLSFRKAFNIKIEKSPNFDIPTWHVSLLIKKIEHM